MISEAKPFAFLLKKDFSLAAAILSAIIAMWLLTTSMRQGAGVGGDATIYITSARNFAAGKGLGLYNPVGEFRLLPYFPPFYPLVLSIFAFSGLDIARAAAVLNVVLFGLTVFSASLWVGTLSRNWIAALLAGLLFAGSPVLIPSYSWAMSEPLCFLLMLLGFILLERCFTRGQRGALVGAGIALGLSFLTRYGSAACILCAGLLLLFSQRFCWKNRLADTLLFGVFSGIPMGIWLIVDIRLTDTVASRSMLGSIDFAAELSRFAGQLRSILCQWLLPDSWLRNGALPGWLKTACAVLITLFVLYTFITAITRSHTRAHAREATSARDFAALLLSLFFFVYIAFVLLISITTFPPITIGARMLLPVLIAFYLLVCLEFARGFQARAGGLVLPLLICVILFGFAAFSGLRGTRIARQNAIDGLGYNAVAWKNSETIAYLRAHTTPDAPIVTNEETALLFLLNRASWPMHEIYVQQPDAPFYAYADKTVTTDDPGREAFLKGQAQLVLFDTFSDQMIDIYGEQTQARIDRLLDGLTPLFTGDDGKIYSMAAE